MSLGLDAVASLLRVKDGTRWYEMRAQVERLKDHQSIYITGTYSSYTLRELFDMFLEEVCVEDLPLYLSPDIAVPKSNALVKEWQGYILDTLS
jgi:hypothetical protein